MANEVIDYAIIGGGISGAYSAWRIKQEQPDANVVLFEYSDRIGGRLFSRRLPGMPNVWAELGGMRYIHKTQPLVTGLIKTMKLDTKAFPMGSPAPVGNKKNYVYFRRRHLFNEQMNDSAKVPYNVDWAESNKSPNDLTGYVLDLLVPNWQKLTFDDWFETKVLGRYLWEWGYWNLLYRVVSPEAYAYMLDGLGYDTNVANGNAVNLMFTAGDTSGSDQYCTLVDGYESLPNAVASHFTEKCGGTLVRNARLAQIDGDAQSGYGLHYVRTVTHNYRTTDTDERFSEQARHVILALPRRSIELVDWAGKHAPFLKENLDSVIIQAAFKLFLGYPYPWWRALGLEAGRSITDIPIRQTFYFGTEGEQKGSKDPGNLNSLLMASYNDLATVPFWKGLEGGEPYAGDSSNRHLEAGVDPVPPSAFVASRQMVEEANKQVAEVHGQRELPNPYGAIYHDWGEDPYGGGWHSWKAGYKYNQIMPQMRQPIPEEKVYICGSAYSNNQGWVEGALETAELMLTENLGFAGHDCSKKWEYDPLRNLRQKLTEGNAG